MLTAPKSYFESLFRKSREGERERKREGERGRERERERISKKQG